MTIEQIRYFIKVVECESFTRASEEYNISQPAISQHIKLLEEKLGVRLLERGSRSFELTDAGHYFYMNCRAIIASFDETISRTRAIFGGNRAVIRVGLPRVYSDEAYAQALSRFSESHPDILVETAKRNYEELTRGLLENHFDLVVNERRKRLRDFYYVEELISAPLYVAIALRNELASGGAIDIEELAGLPCAAVSSGLQMEVEKKFIIDTLGFHGRICFVDTVEEAVMRVVQNQGFSFADAMQGSVFPKSLVSLMPVRLGGQPLSRVYAAFWKKDGAAQPVRQFVEAVKSASRDFCDKILSAQS